MQTKADRVGRARERERESSTKQDHLHRSHGNSTMATDCKYDSKVLKSASMGAATGDESATYEPSAADKLVEGLDEAMAMISDLLQTSSDVMEQFR